VSPPDVPLDMHYHPLGDLLRSVKQGNRFSPVTVMDVKNEVPYFPVLRANAAREGPASPAPAASSSRTRKQEGSKSASALLSLYTHAYAPVQAVHC
jgi:hypothetical protein